MALSKRTTSKRILSAALIAVLLGAGLCVSAMLGYARGFRHGQTITNGWWIEKQSRYYDSSEVEKQRRTNGYDTM